MKSLGYIFGYFASLPSRLSASFAEGYDEGQKAEKKPKAPRTSWFSGSSGSSSGGGYHGGGFFGGGDGGGCGGGDGGGGACAPEVR